MGPDPLEPSLSSQLEEGSCHASSSVPLIAQHLGGAVTLRPGLRALKELCGSLSNSLEHLGDSLALSQ